MVIPSRPLLTQIVLVLILWQVGDALSRWTQWPIPGGIFGLLVLLVLFSTRRVNLDNFRQGSDWFLSEMLLFFVPSIMGVLDHSELLGLVGVKIVALILISTALVMVTIAVVIEGGLRALATWEGDENGHA